MLTFSSACVLPAAAVPGVAQAAAGSPLQAWSVLMDQLPWDAAVAGGCRRPVSGAGPVAIPFWPTPSQTLSCESSCRRNATSQRLVGLAGAAADCCLLSAEAALPLPAPPPFPCRIVIATFSPPFLWSLSRNRRFALLRTVSMALLAPALTLADAEHQTLLPLAAARWTGCSCRASSSDGFPGTSSACPCGSSPCFPVRTAARSRWRGRDGEAQNGAPQALQ